MLKRASVSAVLIGVCAYLFASSREVEETYYPPIIGKKNTLLFLTNDHVGCHNVHLSTVYSLLAKHPEIEVHYASFPKVEKRLKHISSLAAQTNSKAKDVSFHPLPGTGYVDTLAELFDIDKELEIGSHGPGLNTLSKSIGSYIAPWAAEDYFNLYDTCARLIDEIDPAFVIIDTVFAPGIDATRDRNRSHALITPNLLTDYLPAEQPKWTLFWKYPAVGSGHPYPVPWSLIPLNIYCNYKMISGVLYDKKIAAKREILRAMGIKKPIDFLNLYKPDVPFLTQTLPGAHLPMIVMPRNVTLTGPINLAGLEEKTPAAKELLEWAKKPTLMICLGSVFPYQPYQAGMMLEALQNVLKNTDVQVLWKMSHLDLFEDHAVENAIRDSNGRLKIEKWLDVEPPTLLMEGNISAFVHHGGAGSYHDALAGGVPHIILPQWADLYDFAALVENLEIGIWGCRETSPDWTVECLQEAMLLVLKDSPASSTMAKNAAAFGEQAGKQKGRDVAAKEVARLAALGHA
ncbi:hypothetical protein HYFRA_00000497 [Hymenoscyphus fraxineus]|uniref:Erythromycin biosynthesis protein CIII-like C-terminal domain-containing protein n=1 Tax=Hymenoscyphus fraxineus TaxID=746836 RepID=A0A9N9PWT5_9HELO|nr:hypothetical protein HYFRA_00000497 [Hymenoscyphus fraxineus]